MSLRGKLVRVLHPALRGWYRWYGSRPRRYRYADLDLVILPGVFHPGLFGSTRALLNVVERTELQGRTLLELGAGSGLIALRAAQLGAQVTASDVDPQAIACLHDNSIRNQVTMRVIRSDQFDSIPEHFDHILINPPYYAKQPKAARELAFFAGAHREYFDRLFPALAARIRNGSTVHMVLSKDLDLEPLHRMMDASGLRWKVVHEERWFGEVQVVHQLQHPTALSEPLVTQQVHARGPD